MAKDAVFPTFTEPLNSCADLRSKSSPPLTVQTWLTQEPNMQGKLVIVDFFATWCGPCMAARPHMNEIAKQYASTIAVVGLSDESKSNFEDGLKKKNLKEKDFNYAIALDPAGVMKKGFGVRGIPNIAIISSDGIVRWQGHPNSLDAAVLDPLVAANAKLSAPDEKTVGKSGSSGRGWSK
jgi:thiol-disulfide isomerase/thioredoxin